MAKTPPKPVKKKPQPKPKQHPLEPVIRELVDQVTLIADAAKIRDAVVGDSDLPPLSPPEPILTEPLGPPPSDPPTGPVVPPADPCGCDDPFVSEYLNFLKNSAKPLVKCYPAWDPTKPEGQRWEWLAE